jgi:quinol monooxygenase YgiN
MLTKPPRLRNLLKTGRLSCFTAIEGDSMNMSRRTLLGSAAAAIALARSARSAGSSETNAPLPSGDQVFELRQYTLHRAQRDTLIALFEQNFIEPHEKLGSHVYGLFRDLDDPDRFVWIRGFRDMASRQPTLTTFYEKDPAWQAHRTAANATMLDSDNVLMLRPAAPGAGLPVERSAAQPTASIIGATIYYLDRVDSAQFTRFFDDAILPQLTAAGVRPIARFVSEESPNNYPRLPIREHDRAFVWFARWPSVAAEEAFIAKFRALSGWRDSAPEAVLPALMRKPERLRLAPTVRSPLR